MRSITDSQLGVEFDPYTLKMLRNITWSDNLDKPAAPITFQSGSAHPQWDKETGAIHVTRVRESYASLWQSLSRFLCRSVHIISSSVFLNHFSFSVLATV